MQHIVRQEKLDQLLIVVEQLITMKTSTQIKEISENSQCYEFVVKSMKVPVMTKQESTTYLTSLPADTQIKLAVQVMKLICKSGIGDVGFHNILVHKDTKQLVFVDTEPLYGSLLLNEPETRPRQYYRTQEIIKMTNNLEVANGGLNEMIKNAKGDNAIFVQVAQIYKKCLGAIIWKLEL